MFSVRNVLCDAVKASGNKLSLITNQLLYQLSD